jgi:hypothetical protein
MRVADNVVRLDDWRRRRDTAGGVGHKPVVSPPSTGPARIVFGSGVVDAVSSSCESSFTVTHVSGWWPTPTAG